MNQCFRPDVVSTAQHLTDLAVGLSDRGHSVTVVASRRGYDNPDLRFPRREVWKGIQIIRLSTLGLGKKGRVRRALDFASFFFSCVLRLALLPRFDAVVALTSPPLISWLGAMFVRVKGGRLIFWVMDLNPDEAIAAGWLKKDSLAARTLEWFLRSSMHQSAKIIVLDRFVKQRVLAKSIAEEKISVIPPWSHDEAVAYDSRGRDNFRARHGLNGKYVVMYSGNHSPCHPLDTLLAAAQRLSARDDVAFCFAGGGSEHDKVKTFARANELKNVICLPYQPLEELSASLSAADLHVVVMGDAFPGILHPCKVYNILAIGSPFLYIGPHESHITDLSQTGEQLPNRSARHGDVNTVVKIIVESAATTRGKRTQERSSLAGNFSKEVLLPRMIDVVASVITEDAAGGAAISGARTAENFVRAGE